MISLNSIELIRRNFEQLKEIESKTLVFNKDTLSYICFSPACREQLVELFKNKVIIVLDSFLWKNYQSVNKFFPKSKIISFNMFLNSLSIPKEINSFDKQIFIYLNETDLISEHDKSGIVFINSE